MGRRNVSFRRGESLVPTGGLAPRVLRNGNILAGPAIVEQLDATTVIPPGGWARLIPMATSSWSNVEEARDTDPNPAADCRISRSCGRRDAAQQSRRAHGGDAPSVGALGLLDPDARVARLLVLDHRCAGELSPAMPRTSCTRRRTVLVHSVLEKWGRDGIHEGDVIVANHPYLASVPHTPDLAVVVPVFADGELVAFSCTIAHKPDFGGAVPGSTDQQVDQSIKRVSCCR